MNKKRVMKLVTDVANSAYDEAYYHEGSERTDSLIKDIDEELNSKTVMPKVFDDWYKNDSTYGDPNTLKFKIIHFTVMAMWGGKGIESQERLCDWVKKAHKGKYTYDEERFVRCIEAIIHGYEVEK